MTENIDKFIDALRESLVKKTFVKLTLGNYKGADKHLQKIQVRLISTKKGTRLYFLYRSDTRDTAKNYSFEEGIEIVHTLLGRDFLGAHLFTTENDFQLDTGKRGSRLNIAKPTFKSAPSVTHDREKQRWVDQSAFYLKVLGVTSEDGEVRNRAQDKWRQINRYIEILASLIDGSRLGRKPHIRLVDMGSGKGYLTFAAYDYFRNVHGLNISVTGVEIKPDLVEKCNEIAVASEFTGLKFVRGGIADFDIESTDVLIALHACNTATDDAIYKGIQAGASIIVVAPCCHQELRPQIKPPNMLRDVLKHGVLLERTAEFVTDSLRSLLLERSGYATKLLDFVPVEHTPKNLMLVGTRDPSPDRASEIDHEIAEIKSFYSIEHQRLETLLESSIAALR
ncbi:MAG TPA: SAM-dependent methyltransferase [Pyrinomonadaceae bacterium]|nr:SAM-dependent methyltransferase [Pyrinomonadaceae bacterium]